MFGEKALELIKELERSAEGIPPFNDDGIRQVLEEMRILCQANFDDIENPTTDPPNYSSVRVRHMAISRNKRCILAYLYNRLQKIRQMRWEFGSILPPEIKSLLSEPEVQWFTSYSKALATYMRSIGDNYGLNLATDVTPPKSLYIEVRCLVDYGKLDLEDGEVIFLKKNSQYLLPRAECEGLVRQGVLQHVTS
ncbi:DNA replication complex GINS protein PSF1 [Neodiprion pinetum]|uniref:DNA replication complex GINS protein PSF1 n=1 Tax=Neodiprion lecontei TaxID=441921 RepID=A0A6J0C891_NEOLC|nr:DNA replication complex GINS protein PSF1 [Neodiprion lecontei]XP_046417781.1 DNA replication complex GINS protein PSF1-like [Neodiprion fabricii]XP_046473714.1 DNA replication complex GINS protein PSF1-like [Neodiprion pinetum]XP_046611820.1 DNA replication complex GINS protein PSF1-like [Neodiprion virginianus]